MIKSIIFSVLLIFILSNLAFSQSAEKSNIPNIELRLSAENAKWEKGSTAIVNINIENLSDSKIELPTRIDFVIDDGTRADNGNITMRNGVFYAPFSLTKIYRKDTKNCQNNLIDKNVKRNSGTIEIYPDKNSVSLREKEKKNLAIDLADLCWAHQMSSFYPREDVFAWAKTGSYKLYVEMYFDAGTKKSNGIEIKINL